MAYNDSTVYAKYMGGNSEGCSEGCDDGCNKSVDFCECCPPGTVKVSNDSVTGCLTPEDAAQLINDSRQCADGYVALFKNSSGAFYGCVSEANYSTINTLINP